MLFETQRHREHGGGGAVYAVDPSCVIPGVPGKPFPCLGSDQGTLYSKQAGGYFMKYLGDKLGG